MTLDQNLELLHAATIAIVRRGIDLTARQQAVFLTVHLCDGPPTVRGMATAMNVNKPAITRAIDKLEAQDLVRREDDPQDRRSVLVKRTAKGAVFLREMRRIVGAAAGAVREAA
jgi:DNA-binding MarR family transcriptional regulator